MGKWISILAAFLLPLAAAAQAPAAGEEQLLAYRDSVKNGYNFLLYVPASYAERADLPLILCLHGGSLIGRDLNLVTRYGCVDALRRGRDIDAVIICPQCPSMGWDAERLMRVVDWVRERYRTDLNRFYVIGMSMGGWGTYKMVAAYPDKIAAAISMCGGYTGPVEPLIQVPLWIIHGTEDEVTSFSYSNSLVKKMIRTGHADRVHFSWLTGCDHRILARIYLLSQPYDWLFAHSLRDSRRPANHAYEIEPSDLDAAYVRLDPAKARKLPVRKPR